MSMIGHFLATLFTWPNGIVVGNLLASAIWAVPAILHLDRLARKHHKEHMDRLGGKSNGVVRSADEQRKLNDDR